MDYNSLKNLKDFLLQYNRISESCFLHCVNHLSDRDLSQDECGCVDMCTKKHVRVNHKVMQVYMDIQPELINRRVEEMTKEAQKKELEAAQKKDASELKKPEVEVVKKPFKSDKIIPDTEVLGRIEAK